MRFTICLSDMLTENDFFLNFHWALFDIVFTIKLLSGHAIKIEVSTGCNKETLSTQSQLNTISKNYFVTTGSLLSFKNPNHVLKSFFPKFSFLFRVKRDGKLSRNLL